MRNKMINTIGLDSDVCVAMMLNEEYFRMSIPRFFIRKKVYINFIVLRELFGILVFKKKISKEETSEKISKFLYKFDIQKIKKKDIDDSAFNFYLNKLKRYREQTEGFTENKDLEIMSAYKSKNIDCILTRNTMHFEPFSKLLDIEIERLIEDWKLQSRKL